MLTPDASYACLPPDPMPLTLQYHGETTVPLEIEGLTPDVVRGMALAEIERFEAFHGNRKVPLAEFFQVSGDATDGEMVFQGDLSGVHWIGAAMQGGRIRVEGNAGRHVGSEMTGGEITVEGNAGDWVGGEMHGGVIRVAGRAGHLVGAAYRGSRRGMTGGTILIRGDAGNEIGHTMRRGSLVIGGAAGDCPGFNMLAGSIYIFGDCGIRPGAGMRRGTLGLFGSNPPPMLPTFRRAGDARPDFLRMTLIDLWRQGIDFPPALLETPFTLYHGDFVETGRGEILVPGTAT